MSRDAAPAVTEPPLSLLTELCLPALSCWLQLHLVVSGIRLLPPTLNYFLEKEKTSYYLTKTRQEQRRTSSRKICTKVRGGARVTAQYSDQAPGAQPHFTTRPGRRNSICIHYDVLQTRTMLSRCSGTMCHFVTCVLTL